MVKGADLSDLDIAEMDIAMLDLDTGTRTTLIRGGSNPKYAPTGHIVYGVEGALRAVGFDAERLELTSLDRVTVLEAVDTKTSGTANFALADNGALAYVSGTGGTDPVAPRALLWAHRDGSDEPTDLPPGPYGQARLSPDGTKLAVTVNVEVRVSELGRLLLTPLAADAPGGHSPVWAPDSQDVVFSDSYGAGPHRIWRQTFGGNDRAQEITTVVDAEYIGVSDWAPDDGRLFFWYNAPGTSMGIGTILADEPGDWDVLLDDPEANEAFPALSPDGHWIAYVSDETRAAQVYVRRFPQLDTPRPISIDGGSKPRWNPRGGELFYARGDTLVRVPVETSPTSIEIGDAEPFYTAPGPLDTPGTGFDVAPDGQRFLVTVDALPDDAVGDVVLIQNWTGELQRLVPTP